MTSVGIIVPYLLTSIPKDYTQLQRWWKTLEIEGSHDYELKTYSSYRSGGIPPNLQQILWSKVATYIWAKTCYYSDENIFTALVALFSMAWGVD